MDRPLLTATFVILLLTAFTGVNFIYQPKADRLRQLTEALDQEEEWGALSMEVSSLEKRLQGYDGRLMEKDKEEVELIDLVRKIANEIPVRVVSMTPESERTQDRRGPRLVFLRILFEGTYHQLGHLVAKVENSEKFMRIDSLRFTTVGGSPSKTILFEVQISTLRQL